MEGSGNSKFVFKETFDPKEAVMCESEGDILKVLKANPDIQFLRLFFPDLRGRLCDFSIPRTRVSEKSLKEGLWYDGSSVLGHAREYETDMRAIPIPKTARITPWTYQMNVSGFKNLDHWRELIVFAGIYKKDFARYEGDSRYALERTLGAMNKVGANHYYLGPELEFFLFEANGMGRPKIDKQGRPIILDRGSYFMGGAYGELRKKMQLVMQAMGYYFTVDHHEVAHSQHEVNLQYLDAVEMADAVSLEKYILKRIAREYVKDGVPTPLFACFLPKPFKEYEGEKMNGSGMHMHQSLFKDDINLFENSSKELELSDVALKFIAGLMGHARGMSLVLNPGVNSYKRLVPGCEAPTNICWAGPNRTGAIRIPHGARIEYRSPDPSTNIYLAAAIMLNAGLAGIINNYEVTPKIRGSVFQMTREEKRRLSIDELPGSLEEAIACAKKDPLVRETLGDHLFEKLLIDRTAEWNNYCRSQGRMLRQLRRMFGFKDTGISQFEYGLMPVV